MSKVTQQIALEVKTDLKQAIGQMNNLAKQTKMAGDQVRKLPKTVPSNFMGPIQEGTVRVKKFNETIGQTKQVVKETSGALSGLKNMNKMTVFSISNLAQTFQLAAGPAHQMKFVFGQIMDQFALMGPKGLIVGGVVAGLGMLWKAFSDTGDAAEVTSEDLKKFKRSAVAQMQSLKDSIVNMQIDVMFEDMAKGPRRLFEQSKAAAEAQVRMSKGYLDRVAGEQEAYTLKILSLQMGHTKKIGQLKMQLEGREERAEELGQAGLRLAQQKAMFEEQAGKGQIDRMKTEAQLRPQLVDLEKKQAELIAATAPQVLELEKERAAHASLHEDAIRAKTEAMKTNQFLLEQLKNELPEIIAEQERYTEAEKGSTGAKKGKTDALKAEIKATKELLKLEDSILKNAPDINITDDGRILSQKQWEEYKNKSEERIAIVESEAAKKSKELAKTAAAERQSNIAAGINLSVSLLGGMADIMIKGEKKQGERMAAMALKSVGSILVAKGTAAILTGAIKNASLPGSGVAEMVAGGAAVAAGVGMGAGASAITASLAESRTSKTDGNTSAGGIPSTFRAGGSIAGEGAGTVVNISYGVGGPEPESAAQAVLDAMALGSRRGLVGRA